jgi:hypothetical protein
VVTEIRLYVEGGGNAKDTKARLREGFSGFLRSVIDRVREHRIKWKVIACGPRNDAYRHFKIALEANAEASNLLLVDSEGPVCAQPWEHLRARDGWDASGAAASQCHLMVQTMEAWLVADVAALARFYGAGFRRNAIPGNSNVELIDKSQLLSALEAATRDTTKGKYHKTRHAPQILVGVDAGRVRGAAHHCDRLFNILAELIEMP